MDIKLQQKILIGSAITLGVLLLSKIFAKKKQPNAYQQQKGFGPRHEYVMKHGLTQTELQKQLVEKTMTQFPKQAKIMGGQDVAQFMANVIKISNSKQGFEIGVFTGYSTLTMAMALPEDGKIYAVDTNKEYAQLGIEHWQKARVDHKIKLILSNALSYLEELCKDEDNFEKFDFAFVDADKQNQKKYYELLLKLLKKGGWICFDNAMAGGGVYDRNIEGAFNKEDSQVVDELNRELNSDDRVSNILIDIADGVNFVVKL